MIDAMRSVAIVALLVAGCTFAAPSGDPGSGDGDTGIGGAGGGDGDGDGDVDAGDSTATSLIYAGFETDVYAVDVDAETATFIGDLDDGVTTISLQGFALRDKNTGYGIDFADPPNLYTIDLGDGTCTFVVQIDVDQNYWGLTASAAGDAVLDTPALFAGTDTGVLYKIDPVSGEATIVGGFGSSLTVSGDLTWVRDVGLFGTFNGPTCDDCLAQVDHSTGAAKIISATSMNDLWGLSAVGDRLFATRGNGDVVQLDTNDGSVLGSFSTGAAFSMAAP